MANSFVLQSTELYPNCHYLVRDASTWAPTATSATELDNCTTLAAGERILCPTGTHAGIYIAESSTSAVADTSFSVHEGYTVRCIRATGAPIYKQDNASGSASPSFSTITSVPFVYQTAPLTVLSSDTATQVCSLEFLGLQPSKRYVFTVRAVVGIAAVYDSASFGTADLIVSAQILTDADGDITVTLGNTPIPSDHFSSGFVPVVSVAVSGTAIVIKVARPTGVQCRAQCTTYRDDLAEVGANVFSIMMAVAYGQTTVSRSLNGGATWTTAGALTASSGLNAVGICYDSVHSTWIVAGYSPGGPTNISTDNGTTWTNGGTTGVSATCGVAFDRVTGRAICCATSSTSTRYSTDGGVAGWTAGGNVRNKPWVALVANSITGRVHVIANGDNSHDYTDNGGTTWSAGNNLPGALGFVDICHDPNHGGASGRLIVIISGSAATYKSDDDGATWSAGGNLTNGSLSWHGVAVDSVSGRITACADGVTTTNYSDDGGDTWHDDSIVMSAGAHWSSMASS